MEDIIIRLIPLPVHVRAFTMPDAQGDYNVYINVLLSTEQQNISLQHELRHIRRGDFYKRDKTAKEIEAENKG